MATRHISTFPILSEYLAEKAGFLFLDPSFYYEYENEKYELTDSDNDEFFHCLIDKKGIWSPEGNFNLIIEGSVQIKDRSILFGENGIAPASSTIGLALKLSSNQSRRCKSFPFAYFTKNSDTEDFSFTQTFKPGKLRGQVSFSVELFINTSGTPDSVESHLANTVGTIIGSSSPFIVKLDGNNSGINIIEVDKPDEPLWIPVFSSDDPLTNALDAKAFTIELNQAHPSFKFINNKDKTHFNASLYREIIASAMTLFINNLRTSEDGDIISKIINNELDDTPVPGSVAEQIIKFKDELGLDLSTPSTTAVSIRKFIDNGLTEI